MNKNPAIKVSPSDDAATEETAEVLEGMIRQIEYRSDASSVYEQTAESAAASSIGWFRVVNDWADDTSFNQEILIKRIRNSFSVYPDPAAELPTREDAEFLFITKSMKKEDFEAEFPDKKIADAEHDDATDGMEHWHSEGKVVVAEYYWREYEDRELVMFVDGSTMFRDESQEEIPAPAIIRTRKVRASKIMWAKINAHEVLEGPQEIPCKYIPVVAVTGEEWHVGERVYRNSVIRYAKDPQQLYNYFRSSSAEIVTLQPKAPYIGTVKQFAGLENLWKNANASNYSFLPYNPDEKAPGAPQRQQPPVASSGLVNEALAASEDMKATTGIYDAALGNASNEHSGVAIRQRQMESDVSTSIYTDNMGKAIAFCGRILVSMIPRIYDTARNVRVIGQDESESVVPVNQMTTFDGQDMPVNDLAGQL